jgi:hypothetical protein
MPILGSFGAAGVKGFGFTGGSIPPFPIATGGTTSDSGDYRIHTFTGDGTFEVEIGEVADFDYVVIGGGGGGQTQDTNNGGPGGGAGGYREADSTYTSPSPLANPSGQVTLIAGGSFAVTVGAGGVGSGGDNNIPTGTQGSDSSIGFPSVITGSGGGFNATGGSGSGGFPGNPSGRAGNTPPFSPPQGNPGGTSTNTSPPFNGRTGGGGGGAGGSGSTTSPGAGTASNITGSAFPTKAYGGQGWPGGSPGAKPANSGAGGSAANPKSSASGAGGSGIVYIRYKFQ